MSKYLVKAWYEGAAWLRLLLPLSALFAWLSRRRRHYYRQHPEAVYRAPVPVIIIGNITLGGSGKTPLVAALAQQLRQAGYQPGIVSRGYGSRAPQYPFHVTPESKASVAGDEALLLAQRSHCPVVIDPERPRACRALLHVVPDCDLILSDDGLQHYALGRDIEIAVIDAERGLGNGYLLPAGPLRERPERLRECDFVIINGAGVPRHLPAELNLLHSALQVDALINLGTGEQRTAEPSSLTSPVHSIAGIGHPERFFRSLSALGFAIIPHGFPDHHDYQHEDLPLTQELPLVMTEKDAVKCRALLSPVEAARCWYLQVSASPDAQLLEGILQQLSAIKR